MPLDNQSTVMVKITSTKERYIIRNIAILDAVDGINANFSIQVKLIIQKIHKSIKNNFSDDFRLYFCANDEYFHDLSFNCGFCISSADEN